MRVHQYNPGYTITDYNMWDGDWELIDGYPYAMSPSASFKHQNIQSELNAQVRGQLKKIKESCGSCTVVSDLDWIVNDNTIVRPDLAVVCNQTDKFITSPPKLVVEILSPSTALKDRHIKYDIYEEQGVPYYIIIDPDTLQYNIYVLKEGYYTEQNGHTQFNIDTGCSVELIVADILVSI